MPKALSDYRLEENVDAGDYTITVGSADGDEEIDPLGWTMSYTIGDFEVPREWLVQRMEELGLPEWSVPTVPTKKRAFDRTRKRLLNDENDETTVEYEGRELTVKFEVEMATREEFHILAKTWFPADVVGGEDGQFRTTTLGIVKYNAGAPITTAKVPAQDPLYGAWERFETRVVANCEEAARVPEQYLPEDESTVGLYQWYQNSHIGRDVQKMMYRYVNHWTDSVKLRDGGAVYFVPVKHTGSLEALKDLVSEMDEKWKFRGKDLELQRWSVVDREEERRQVQRRVEKHLREAVQSRLEDAFEALDDASEEVAEEAVAVAEDLSDEDNLMTEYNALLDAELRIQDILEDWVGSVTGAEAELVEEVMAEREKNPATPADD